MDFVKTLFKGDKYIWGIYLVLAIISVIEIFSATSTLAYRASEHFMPAFTHTTYLIIGTLAVLVMHNWPPHYFKGIGYLMYPASIFLLVAVKFTPGVNNAQRWIFGLQPSELAKFSLIIVVCHLLAKGQTQEGISRFAFRAILIAAGIACTLIVSENFSTAFLLGTITFFLMFIARVQWKRMLAILGSVVVLGGLFLAVLTMTPKNYLPGRMATWKGRIERKADDSRPLVEQRIDDKNLQVQFGRMAVANGGLIGRFPGNSEIRDFLPQAYSDYIYSIIIEEMGFLMGGVGVLILYFMLLVRAGIIFRRCKNPFLGFLLLGATMMVVFQAFINMAVGVDLIPVTGQPLPLISRGGTSMFLTCGYFGVILGISRSVGMGEEDYDENRLIGETTQTDEAETEQALIAESEEEEVIPQERIYSYSEEPYETNA
ncbi:MAG: FtsW/RodA/SpoVE family cell cycle protein [Bacteroidales bacterium]